MSAPRTKIAILGTRGIPARYGGFETFAEEIAVRLVERGIDVTVYCEDPGSGARETYRGVRLVHVPAPRFGPLTTILFDVRCLLHARRGFEVVYMLGYGAAPFCAVPRLWGTRVWLNVDGIEWARAKWGRVARAYFKLMELLSLHAPTRVIADAQAICDHLRARHGSRKPISVIPYGARIVRGAPDPAPLARWGLEPESYYIVVCRLEPENHVREILRGFSRSSSGRSLVVVGDHESGTPYVAELTTVKDRRVRFLGPVYDRNALEALRYHAFAYCHGHSVGGTNPSLLEGLGCGNAVVAHDNPFNREVARHAAVYFSSEASFADRIDALEASDLHRQRLRRAALEIAARDYTWDGIADRYLALIERDRRAAPVGGALESTGPGHPGADPEP